MSRVDDIIALATPQIVADEGFRAKAYRDTLSRLTIGYGRCDAGVWSGMTCTKAQAAEWRDTKIDQLVEQLTARIPWWSSLPVAKAAALLNMAYQLGTNGLLNFTHMIASLHAGDFAAAGRQALESRWATQTPERAQRIAGILSTPSSPDLGRDATLAAIGQPGATP